MGVVGLGLTSTTMSSFRESLQGRATAKKFECLRKQALPIGIGLHLIGLTVVAEWNPLSYPVRPEADGYEPLSTPPPGPIPRRVQLLS